MPKSSSGKTDVDGVYKHPNPEAGGVYLVSDFRYFGTDTTDADGKFDFLTYRVTEVDSSLGFGLRKLRKWLR